MANPTPAPLSTYLFRHGHLFLLIIVILLVAGFSSLRTMPRLEDPRITTRHAQVVTLVPGASSERVEALVTKPLESRLREVSEILHLDTTSRSGLSHVNIELQGAVTAENNQEIFSRIRDKIDEAALDFPPGTLAPMFDNERGASAFSVVAGLTWTHDSEPNLAILNRQADLLADRLRNLSGTEYVQVFGEPREEITVEIDPRQAASLGVSLAELSRSLQAADAKIPAGILREPGTTLPIEVTGRFDSLDRVLSTPVREMPGEGTVYLGDLAEVSKGYREPQAEIAFNNGLRAIYVGARTEPDQRIDLWTQSALALIEEFAHTSGAGIEVAPVFVQDEYTSQRLGSLAFNLFLGGLVVLAVILLTMGWRNAVIVGSALPLTAALTVGLMGFGGGKLHQMSIFGMIIALGLLIDSAIVISDEVRRNLDLGRTRRDAVSAAVRHLFVPLLSSTLTTILAFMPILLLPGDVGDFVSSIGGSVIVALASSLFVAIALIATLSGRFLKPRQNRNPNWLQDGLQWNWAGQAAAGAIGGAIRRPVRAMAACTLLALFGFLTASQLGVEFFPRTDRNMFTVKMWLATETSIEETTATAQQADDLIRQSPEVSDTQWMIGESFPSVYYNLLMNKDNSPFYAQAVVKTTTFREVKPVIRRLQRQLDEALPQAQVVVEQLAQGPPAEAGVEFRIYGPDIDRLQALGDEVRARLARHPDILTTRVTLPRGEPKLWIEADEEEARLAGLPLAAIAEQLQGNLEGFTGGAMLEGTEELPVRVRFRDSHRSDLAELATTPLISPVSDDWLSLDTIAPLVLRPEDGGITRRDGERVNIIYGWTRNEALPIVATNAIVNALEADGFDVPPGYRFEVGGTSENQEEAVGDLLLYIPVIITLTIAVLVLTFQSFRLAALLGVVAFLSVGFGLLATRLYGLPLSFNTILGSFGLVGLAFNSSIVVIAAIRARAKDNPGDPEAMAEAVLGSTRHLVSTTLTTVGSFVPLLILIGGDFWPPLAIVLSGGVLGSTLLALIFTPAAYRLLEAGKVRRQVESKVEPPETTGREGAGARTMSNDRSSPLPHQA